MDGLWTDTYENGQPRREGIFEEGKRIYYIEWDQDGHVVDWYKEEQMNYHKKNKTINTINKPTLPTKLRDRRITK